MSAVNTVNTVNPVNTVQNPTRIAAGGRMFWLSVSSLNVG